MSVTYVLGNRDHSPLTYAIEQCAHLDTLSDVTLIRHRGDIEQWVDEVRGALSDLWLKTLSVHTTETLSRLRKPLWRSWVIVDFPFWETIDHDELQRVLAGIQARIHTPRLLALVPFSDRPPVNAIRDFRHYGDVVNLVPKKKVTVRL